MDTPYIPLKFRAKPIPKEPEDQQRARYELSLQTIRTEVNILQSKSKLAEEKFHEVDHVMLEEICKTEDAEVQQKLSDMWHSICKQEEEK